VPLIPPSTAEDCVRVGIDGVDGAGKTTFADALATTLQQQGRPVVRVSVDDFHHPRAIRYARGRMAVTDRPGLEAVSCECYHTTRREFARLLGPSPATRPG